MTRSSFIVLPVITLLALSGCVPTPAASPEPASSPEPSETAETAAAPRPWGESPVEQFAVGSWQCRLFLDGAELPYGVAIAVSGDGLYSVEVGGSGAFQNFSLTVADGETLALGEPGEVDAEVGQTARVEGIPTELPAAGESVTISRFPEGASDADVVATVSLDGDIVTVKNPTFGADEMSCARS